MEPSPPLPPPLSRDVLFAGDASARLGSARHGTARHSPAGQNCGSAMDCLREGRLDSAGWPRRA